MTIAADRYSEEMVYRKVGRRYVAIEPFQGFPTPGVWLVTDKSHHRSGSCRRETVCIGVDVQHLGDVPDPMDFARLERHRDAAVDGAWAWMKDFRTRLDAGEIASVSANRLVDLVFGAIVASMAGGAGASPSHV